MKCERTIVWQTLRGSCIDGIILMTQPTGDTLTETCGSVSWPRMYQSDGNIARIASRSFRRIFASYSHRDTEIVDLCQKAAIMSGNQFIRDNIILSSGDDWDEKLLKGISDADVFQLFWSKYAAHSPHVEREWRYALPLHKTRAYHMNYRFRSCKSSFHPIET